MDRKKRTLEERLDAIEAALESTRRNTSNTAAALGDITEKLGDIHKALTPQKGG